MVDLSEEGGIESVIKKDIWKYGASQAHTVYKKKNQPPKKALSPAPQQKEPKTLPFYLQLPVNQYITEEPTNIWTTRGEKSVPKIIFHFSKAISKTPCLHQALFYNRQTHTMPTLFSYTFT